MAQTPSTTTRATGAQTLQRGLRTLRAVTQARDGLTITEISEAQGIHRTIASRILHTLTAEGLTHRGPDGRYRGAAGLLELTAAAHAATRAAALEPVGQAADAAGATVSFLVEDGAEAVALAVVEPRGTQSRITFAEGHRHPLDRGAAGAAILSLRKERATDPDAVRNVRQSGFAQSFSEVEPGMHGLAVPVHLDGTRACVNLITHREELLEPALPHLRRAAQQITETF